MDLPKVASQRLLIDDFENLNQSMATKCSEPIIRIAVEKHVTGKERHDGSNQPALRCVTLFDDLGKEVNNIMYAEITGSRLLLTRLGMQAPPDRFLLYTGSESESSHRFVGWQSGSVGRIGMANLEMVPVINDNRSRNFPPEAAAPY